MAAGVWPRWAGSQGPFRRCIQGSSADKGMGWMKRKISMDSGVARKMGVGVGCGVKVGTRGLGLKCLQRTRAFSQLGVVPLPLAVWILDWKGTPPAWMSVPYVT